ncbi:hypothetical protein GALMADRAFT_231915 [Galerina marginata CBS 339.88]|uniref:F-box domain-containing protein n=1 Tax=Galerina marginata (strain CBS 339.88) TaxID=685588 RepID=A0A067SC02_GALM3|nr:hypothetical protein GALMADRAFT_231915 [Galerina marginata CBS 339.88]
MYYFPPFPLDIERLIFEVAAVEYGPDRKAVANLLLVAKRVHDWIRPILYHIFTQHMVPPEVSPPFPDFEKRPDLLGEVGKFAKHLFIGPPTKDKIMDTLLLSCPNVENLALWFDYPFRLKPYLPAIQKLPLKRLSCCIGELAPEDIQKNPLCNLTHLDIFYFDFDHSFREKGIKALPSLPYLTHLAIGFVFPSNIGVDALNSLLLDCPHLRILVIFSEKDDDKVEDQEVQLARIDSLKLVLIVLGTYAEMEEDWHNGARGGVDFWIFAERFSSARRDKLLVDTSQRWLFISFDWVAELNDQGLEWYSRLHPK